VRKYEDPHPRLYSVGDALALRNVVGTISRKRSQDIVNTWRMAEILTKAKAKALNFRQGPARATTRSRIEARPRAMEEGGRRATGAAHYQRRYSADMRDRSAAALERGVGRVRWRGRRKYARNWDGGSGARGSGRDRWPLAGAPDRAAVALKVHSASAAPRSLGGSSRIEAKPRAAEEEGRWAMGGAHYQRWCSAESLGGSPLLILDAGYVFISTWRG
jgi:hypothetical protein